MHCEIAMYNQIGIQFQHKLNFQSRFHRNLITDFHLFLCNNIPQGKVVYHNIVITIIICYHQMKTIESLSQ